MASEKKTNISDIIDEDENIEDEEPGEEIESAPPMKVGEEREINSAGVKKKLVKRGAGWETPDFGYEVTVHYVGMLVDGTKFDSTRDREQPFTFKLGHGQLLRELETGIISMKKGEIALFTLPPEMAYGDVGLDGVPPGSVVQYEVELLSWIVVVDMCKDGAIVKRILERTEGNKQPSDLDEVLVKYQIMLPDGTTIARTTEQGVEFYVKDGHLIPALPKVIKTMKAGEKANLIIQPQYGFGDVGREASAEFPSVPPNSVLRMDLDLVSFKPVIDVGGDSKIIKKILKEGEGTITAGEGAVVNVRYVGKLEDGTVFEKKGFDGQAPLEFITDEEQVIAGLDRAVSTMSKGEKALLTIHSDYGFGAVEMRKDLAVVPPSSNLVYEIEMLDFIKEKAPWEMTGQERTEAAGKKKEEGNILFKSGKYQRAGKKYDKAADYVSKEGNFGDEEEKVAKALRVSCWLNGAACSLKLNDFKEAVDFCSKVLDIESQNIKALYRRAQAYMENSDLDLAEFDVKKALEVDPNNREVKVLQKNLKRHQAESNKRDANFYANMFSRLAKDTNVPAKKQKLGSEEDEGDEPYAAASSAR